jgi:hypothetical protein
MPPLFVDNALPTIELYGLAGDVGVWDDPLTTWDGAGDVWADATSGAPAWRSVACQVSAFSSSWGADEGQGVLAQSAAGTLTLRTYDPDRILDPANASSPLRRELVIGTPVRLVGPGPVGVLGYGYLDEVEYRYEDAGGTLVAADEVAKLAQANTAPTFWQPVNSLRALAAAAIASAGQSTPVGSAPAAGDPVIAWRDTRDAPVWDLIRDAATDALCLAWIDRQTSPPTLALAPFGYPTDAGLRLGDGGIPFAGLQTVGSGAGVVNVVDDTTGELARRVTATGRDQSFGVSRVEPAGVAWARAILSDRGGATVTVIPGEVYPSNTNELLRINQARGLELVRVTLLDPPFDVTLRLVGTKIEGEAGGIYRATLATYSPGEAWAYLPPAPALPAATPSTRSIRATKDAGIGRGTGVGGPGAIKNYGNGLGPMTVGYSAATGLRGALLAFDGLDLAGVRRIRKIELVLVFDSAGDTAGLIGETALVQRISGQWSEGRVAASDTSSVQTTNSVVWPGPPVDAATVPVTIIGTGPLAEQRVDITSIAMLNMPINLGGRGYPDFGYRVQHVVLGTPGQAPGYNYLRGREDNGDEPTGSGCRLELTVEV